MKKAFADYYLLSATWKSTPPVCCYYPNQQRPCV